MDTIARVRRAYFVQGRKIKAIARDLRLARNTVRDILRAGSDGAEQTKRCCVRKEQPLPQLGAFVSALQAMVTAGQIQERALTDYYLHLDEQIGALFESLSDETLALVISPYGVEGQGWFILASSNNPLSGEVADVSLLEIAPTLLELGGYPISETMQGVSLVAGKALDLLASGDLSDEEEQLLRERLSGLGYIS